MMREALKNIFNIYRCVKTPTILQLSETECGITALAIVFAYYGLHLPLEILREQCGVSRDGCKASTLTQIAKKYGFTADAYQVDIETIYLLREPVIAFWNFSHYVVINYANKNKVFINDPARGNLIVNIDTFDKAFTGVILVIKPGDKAIKCKKKNILLESLRAYLKGFYKESVFIMICLIMMMCFSLCHSMMAGIFIEQLLTRNFHLARMIAWLSLFIISLLTMTTIMQKWQQFVCCTKACVLKTSEIIKHMLQLPCLFYSLRQKSEIIALLCRVEMIAHLFFTSTSSLIVNSLALFICFVFMFNTNGLLFFISCSILLLSSITIGLLARVKISQEKANLHIIGQHHGYTISSIKNIETIKACSLQEKILKTWQGFLCQKLMIRNKLANMDALQQGLNHVFYMFTLIIIFYIGAIQVARGVLSISHLLLYYILQTYLFTFLNAIVHGIKNYQSAYTSFMRIHDVMAYKIDERFTKIQPISADTNKNTILSCRGVHFYYNQSSSPTLTDIHCDIQAGQHIGIVGSTGSGKSTLAKILSGLFLPQRGCVNICGMPIAELHPAALSRFVAYVSQDVSLFSGTIYDNLTMWNKHVDLSDLHKAIKIACLEEVINAKGLFSKVEEGGVNFSGGEKQRIDIARAFVQATPIIIFDEATAALDVQTEIRLMQQLRETQKTMIFIAHRLSTIQLCDHILVIEKGKQVECGTHRDLLAKKGHYFNLIKNE